MYLTEYLKMRGVKANALTNAEAALLGIDITAKGWVERNAHIVVPEELADAVRNGARKVELRALATSLMNGALPLDAAHKATQSINPAANVVGDLNRCSFDRHSYSSGALSMAANSANPVAPPMNSWSVLPDMPVP